jgi:hypothetical protein
VSADPNVADPAESVLLTIGQPFANHNGGMVEFGPDGFLYIATGDGGAGNDPDNRAQNPNDLLGKILRIDVDRSEGGRPYAAPPGNPFAGTSAGRGEIYALGLRNPWRFSFDRATGELFAGDVGQGEIEEIDRIVLGGNYGWRVFEGTRCTGLGPAACSAAFIPPITEYSHENGRCSVTGGYVYRGSRASLPSGSYVFGDFCTGEIFLLQNGAQSLLLRPDRRISSFGEDEAGEIYITGLDTGTVDRIVNPDAPAVPTFYFPRLVTATGRPDNRNEHTGFGVANLGDGAVNLTFTARGREGTLISGPDVANPRVIELRSGEQIALVDSEIFGSGLEAAERGGWVALESTGDRVVPFFLGFDSALSTLDGGNAASSALASVVLTEVETSAGAEIHVANPHADATQATIELVSAAGAVRARAGRSIPGSGAVFETLGDLFPGTPPDSSDYVRILADQGVVAFAYLRRPGQDSRGVPAADATSGARTLYAPQYAVGGQYVSRLSVVNLEPVSGTVRFRLLGEDGPELGGRELQVEGFGKIYIDDPAFFVTPGAAVTQGFVQVVSSVRVVGSVEIADSGQTGFSTSLPLVSSLGNDFVYSQVASDSVYFTGIALVNPADAGANAAVEVFGDSGALLAAGNVPVVARGRRSALLTELFPALVDQAIGGGYIRVRSDRPLASFVVFGARNLSVLSGIPGIQR